MKVFFRADASTRMGTGHLMRCLALAEALRGRGVQVGFVCREHPGNLILLLQQRAIPVAVLPAPAISTMESGENYAAWLGVTQDEDAAQTVAALDGEKPDWLVVDHYGLDAAWEQKLRAHVGKLMVIDDLINRAHDCDILLDQNYSAETRGRYAGFVPGNCRLLMGPRYALLRSEYAGHRKTLRTRDGLVKRVLVFFGGSDPHNATGMALEALSCAELRHLDVDVVIGANNPHREALENQAKERPQTTVHGARPHLADLMEQADLAIGAGGATTWERMCLGLPSLAISIAENQQPSSKALAEASLIYYAGHGVDVRAAQLAQLLIRLSNDRKGVADMSARNRLQVDGLGALRLAEVLCPSDSNDIRLRRARDEDIIYYYYWANDPEVRKSAINIQPIPWATHEKWFANKVHDANSYLFVLEAAGLPVGQIRFDKEGDAARIDYSLDEIVRGRGWGAKLVSLGMERLQETVHIGLLAEVRADNEASRAVFQRLGFAMTAGESNYLVFRRESGKINQRSW